MNYDNIIIMIIFLILAFIICYNNIENNNIENNNIENNNIENFDNVSSITRMGNKLKELQTDGGTLNDNLIVQGNVFSNNTMIVPIGTITPFFSNNIPAGWLKCDGQVINKSIYPKLYEIIGGTFNGDAKLPDLTERVPLCKSGSRPLGQYAGEQRVILDDPKYLPNHGHDMVADGNHNHDYPLYTNRGCDGKYAGYRKNGNSGPHSTPVTGDHTHNITPTGGNQPHDNIMPYYVLNYIIRAT